MRIKNVLRKDLCGKKVCLFACLVAGRDPGRSRIDLVLAHLFHFDLSVCFVLLIIVVNLKTSQKWCVNNCFGHGFGLGNTDRMVVNRFLLFGIHSPGLNEY